MIYDLLCVYIKFYLKMFKPTLLNIHGFGGDQGGALVGLNLLVVDLAGNKTRHLIWMKVEDWDVRYWRWDA